MIGTNNTGHRQDPPAETAAGIKAIIDRLEKKLPKTKVLLLAIFPRGARPDDRLGSSAPERPALGSDIVRAVAQFTTDVGRVFL
jgi:beta-glucosidase